VTKAVVNVGDMPLQSTSTGSRFAVATGEIGEALGLKGLGAMLHAVPAGKTAFEELRYLALSTKPEVDVVDYPDADSFGVVAGLQRGDFNSATFKYMGRQDPIDPADYWK